MKTFKINRNSWHYKLNKNYMNDLSYRMDVWEAKHTNFCSYWRATIFRVFVALVGVVAALLVLLVLAVAAINDPITFAVVIVSIIGVVVASIVVAGLSQWLETKMARPYTQPDNPSLIAQWYSAKKSKICPMVEFDA